jgi:hypothetical protein
MTITVRENDVIDLGCEISYVGHFRPTLTWNAADAYAENVVNNVTLLWENVTLTSNVTLNATEDMNTRSAVCSVSFVEGKGPNEPGFPEDTNQTEYAREPPEFRDTCTMTLNVHCK